RRIEAGGPADPRGLRLCHPPGGGQIHAATRVHRGRRRPAAPRAGRSRRAVVRRRRRQRARRRAERPRVLEPSAGAAGGGIPPAPRGRACDRRAEVRSRLMTIEDARLDALAAALTEAGLAGTSEDDLLARFCTEMRAARLPIERALVAVDTLHP